MGLFNKLFGNDSGEANSNIQRDSKTKATIFDFFEIDLRSIPDISFHKGETTINTAGETVQVYYKSLPYKECEIFNTVEIKTIGETGKNILFKSPEADRIKIQHLEALINELYLIYGPDADNKGLFTKNDIEDYTDSEFTTLFGRMWSEYPKHKYPVMIGRDGQEVTLTIWTTNKE